jgi:hypothetical protein
MQDIFVDARSHSSVLTRVIVGTTDIAAAIARFLVLRVIY